MACESALCEPLRFCCATSELMLLLIPSMEDLSNKLWIYYRHRQRRKHSLMFTATEMTAWIKET
jgi:hypothetical protein